ncbi:hypothetical protein K8I85_16080 [bacterium]|nr:hypothetical protein [bacterium]
MGCVRDESVGVDRNRPPETYVTLGPEVSSDPNDPTDIFYRAHLFWRGEDPDGTVDGFRFAVDDTSDPSFWSFTTRTDSVFRFQAGEVGAQEHLFLIRAVDNLGKQDASPDTLRFESFTRATPRVEYIFDQICATSSQGTECGHAPGDTVLVNSSITFVWTGSDEDGEVVRWESAFGSEEPVQHARDDTTRTISNISSGQYQFLVTAIDDAGAISTVGGSFEFACNFDPVTTMTSFVSTLPRPWVPDTLVTVHAFGGGAIDTIPYGATVKVCWTDFDPDGPIVRTLWRIHNISGATMNKCVDTFNEPWIDNSGQTVTTPRPLDFSAQVPIVVTLRGEDIYANVEGLPEEHNFVVNYPPTVTLQNPGNVPSGVPIEFAFQGFDRDGNPALLRYRWSFDGAPLSALTQFAPGDLFIDAFFQPNETGSHTLELRAQDAGGVEAESEPVQITFNVTSPPVPPTVPAEGESR